ARPRGDVAEVTKQRAFVPIFDVGIGTFVFAAADAGEEVGDVGGHAVSLAGIFGDFLVLLVVDRVAVVPHDHRPLFAVEADAEGGAAGAVVGPAQPFPENGLAVRLLVAKVVGDQMGIERLLVVVPAVFAAAGRDPRGVVDAEPPAGYVQGVDAVVAELAVPPVPFPVPFVMHDVVQVRLLGGG